MKRWTEFIMRRRSAEGMWERLCGSKAAQRSRQNAAYVTLWEQVKLNEDLTKLSRVKGNVINNKPLLCAWRQVQELPGVYR